jgi:hypothetical protein
MDFWTGQRVVVTGGAGFEDGPRRTADWLRAVRASQLLST